MESRPMPAEPLPLAESLRERYFLLLILAVTAITYLATLRFDFVSDDFTQIKFNPFIKNWSYVPQYFSGSIGNKLFPLASGNHYRPLFQLFLRTNYAFFADRTTGWHFVAVALHLTATWLVFLVVRKITGRFSLAWLSALIFALHPVHHEVIAWVSGTAESLVAVLFLSAFLAYLQSRDEWKTAWMALSCGLYMLAILANGIAIVLPVLVFAHEWIGYASTAGTSRVESVSRFRKAIVPASFYVPFACLFLVVRRGVLAGLGHSQSSAPLAKWFMTLPSILLFYFRQWFLPFRFSELYDVSYQTGFSVLHVLVPSLVLAAVGVALWIVRDRLDARLTGYAVAWIVIPLLPALYTVGFRPDELVHDRFFYIPSIGAALLTALIIERATQSRSSLFGQPLRLVGAGVALAVVLAFFSARAASPWVDDYALYSRANEVAPLNSTAANGLSEELINMQEYDKAQSILEAGYRDHPDDSSFALNLGRLAYRQGDYQKAGTYIQRAIALSPDKADSYISLGQIQLRQGHPAEAQKSMGRAVELNPYHAPFHTSYGIVLALNGDCTAADQQFEAALALNPGEGLTQLQMARCRASLSSGKAPATKPGQL